MGKQLNSFYSTFMNPGLITYLQSNDLDIEWIIEAGCHDGADTKQFLADQRFKQIFAFEPDPIAFKAAKRQLKDSLDRVTLRNIVLMDKPGAVRALPLNGEFGTGSTIFSQLKNITNSSEPINTIMASRLDDEIPSVAGGGALWLDVEGSAHRVLSGGTRILKQVMVAQIEIDMHAQSIYRNKNYRTV
jgi:FkbM family methyltransferase